MTELEYRSFPSASMTEMTSDALANERLQAFLTRGDRGVGVDAFGDVAAVGDDAAHGGVVQLVHRDHLDPPVFAVGVSSAVR